MGRSPENAGQTAAGEPRLCVAVVGIAPNNVHFLTYVRHLVDHGHDVTVVTNAESVDADVSVINFGRHSRLIKFAPSGFRILLRVCRVRKALRRGGFDVVSVQQMTPDGVYAALLSRAPVVPTFWGSDLLRLEIRPWFVRRLMPVAVRCAALIHATCEEIAQIAMSMGARPEDVETFNYGIDLSVFSGTGPESRDLYRMVCTRGLRPFYRTAAIIEALPGVIARFPEAKLVLAGDGQPGDRELLEAVALREGVADRVEFTGRLSPSQIAIELRRAAVWVSIPPTDSFALSLQEAMACGAFPVTTDLRAMREGIDDSRGILLSEVVREKLMDALCEGLSRSSTGAHVAANRAMVETKCDRTVNLARWETMLMRAADMGGHHDER
ncbi:MAG: glycosyltransferase family 4 protein [Coriobacteriia bacterium]|nr:glycosyltransferase family 4 protein [Coriobacteriia bacterium]